MADRFKVCIPKTPHSPPVPYGYKECPECGKLLKLQGFGGHMWGVHGIRVGDKARLNKVYEWMMATTRDTDTGIIRIPGDAPIIKLYQPKQS